MSTIKVVFNEEVRRVQVAGAISGASYVRLEETIRSLFPALSGSRFALVWQDDEGDKVSISSAPEFFEALQVMSYSRGVPRFTVKPLSKSVVSIVHTSVTCDECGVSPIQGNRFKCTVRNDFDLCEGCESRRVQPYPMLKITTSAPLRRVAPFGGRCGRGQASAEQPQQFAVNPVGRHFGQPIRVAFAHPQCGARHPLFSPFGRSAAPSASPQSKETREQDQAKLDEEVLSFLQALGVVPREQESTAQKTSEPTVNSPSSSSSQSAPSATAQSAERASAADRLESELTSILHAIFSGAETGSNNNTSSSTNTNSSSNSSSSSAPSGASSAHASSSASQQLHRNLNDEDEALQRAIRESLRAAQQTEQLVSGGEKLVSVQDEEADDDAEDVWSESASVSSVGGSFQVVDSVSAAHVLYVEPESVQSAAPVSPTPQELFTLWQHELALLASMGFTDSGSLVPLLQAHEVRPASANASSSEADSSGADSHHADGLQRVVAELLRGKF